MLNLLHIINNMFVYMTSNLNSYSIYFVVRSAHFVPSAKQSKQKRAFYDTDQAICLFNSCRVNALYSRLVLQHAHAQRASVCVIRTVMRTADHSCRTEIGESGILLNVSPPLIQATLTKCFTSVTVRS